MVSLAGTTWNSLPCQHCCSIFHTLGSVVVGTCGMLAHCYHSNSSDSDEIYELGGWWTSWLCSSMAHSSHLICHNGAGAVPRCCYSRIRRVQSCVYWTSQGGYRFFPGLVWRSSFRWSLRTRAICLWLRFWYSQVFLAYFCSAKVHLSSIDEVHRWLAYGFANELLQELVEIVPPSWKKDGSETIGTNRLDAGRAVICAGLLPKVLLGNSCRLQVSTFSIGSGSFHFVSCFVERLQCFSRWLGGLVWVRSVDVRPSGKIDVRPSLSADLTLTRNKWHPVLSPSASDRWWCFRTGATLLELPEWAKRIIGRFRLARQYHPVAKEQIQSLQSYISSHLAQSELVLSGVDRLTASFGGNYRQVSLSRRPIMQKGLGWR